MAWSCSGPKGPHYTINGNIEGSDTITFLLQKRDNGKLVTIDSAVSKKGSFKMKGGKVDYPQLVYLIAGNTRKRTSFYLENADITITGKLDSLADAKFTGSKTQDEYETFKKSNKPLTDAYQELVSQYQSAKQANDAAKIAQIEAKADSLQTQMTQLQKDFIKSHPASFATPDFIQPLSYEMSANEIEEMINALDTSVAKVQTVQTLKERVAAMRVVEVGQKAPDFTLNDPEGKPISLSSKLGPKVLLLDFWASWCGPCRQENPNVVKVYNEFHKKGFDVFGVSLDRERDSWVKAIGDDKLTWTHVSDLQFWNNAAAKLYAVNSIPANFLLDENGRIIGHNLRGEDLYNKVKEILGAKK